MSNTQDPIARQTPLVDLLAAVPADARLVIEDPEGKGTHFIPIGRLCREAIAALQLAAAQPKGDTREAFEAWYPEGCAVKSATGKLGALQGFKAGAEWQAATAQASEPSGYTYASKQATKCAGCGEHKHTPLRIDAMGGYVCLTCIDKKLESLLDAAPARAVEPMTITEDAAWNLAKYVYAHSNPHESPQILLSAMEIKQIIERAHGIHATTPTQATQGDE